MVTSEAVSAPVLSTGTEFDRVKIKPRDTPALTEQQIRDIYCVNEIVATICAKAAAAVGVAASADDSSECCGDKKQDEGRCCGNNASSNSSSKPDSLKPIKVVALQFPDHMLPDSPAIAEVLESSLRTHYGSKISEDEQASLTAPMVYILADTSYSPCCVDVVAGQHVSADLIVHFGNACLSPVRGVEVVYVFGRNLLDADTVYERFVETYGTPDSVDPEESIYFVYDPEYEFALHAFVQERLKDYKTVVPTWIMPDEIESNVTILPARDFIPARDTLVKSSQIPVRKYPAPPAAAAADEDGSTPTRSLFYVTSPNPSPSLLLHLSTLFSAIHLLEAPGLASVTAPRTQLMRRYRYMNMARTAGTVGILVNTLSLRDVRGALTRVQNWIKAAGKKHYTFVVGKPNVAKLANFDVVEIWVVLGCPLGGIVVDCEDYYRPIITPYELSLALQEVPEWSGKWEISLTDVLEKMRISDEPLTDELPENNNNNTDYDYDDDDRPVFDPVTGKYVSTSRPLRQLAHVDIAAEESDSEQQSDDSAQSHHDSTERGLVVKHSSQLVIKNTVSTAADHLYNKLSWAGLGSDFNKPADSDSEDDDDCGGDEDGDKKKNKHVGNWAVVEKGRAGVARGYRVNADDDRT